MSNRIEFYECETDEQKKSVWGLFFRAFPNASHGIENINLYIEKVCKFAHIVVASEKGNVIGFIAFYVNDLETRTAYITQLLIDEAWRNRGVGKALLIECERICKEKEFDYIKLEVSKNNQKAIGFYMHYGFESCDETQKSFYLLRRVGR